VLQKLLCATPTAMILPFRHGHIKWRLDWVPPCSCDQSFPWLFFPAYCNVTIYRSLSIPHDSTKADIYCGRYIPPGTRSYRLLIIIWEITMKCIIIMQSCDFFSSVLKSLLYSWPYEVWGSQSGSETASHDFYVPNLCYSHSYIAITTGQGCWDHPKTSR
jgi:hypothetical protein